MVEIAITWMQSHPLEAVAILAGISIVAGLVLVPRVHEIARHGPPRC